MLDYISMESTNLIDFTVTSVTLGPLEVLDTSLTVNTSCSLSRVGLVVRNGKQRRQL